MMTDKPKPKPKLPNLGQLVNSLKRRVEQIERDLRAIKDILNTKDNWHSETKDWIEKMVHVRLHSGETESGNLLWLDRYNICISCSDYGRVIIPKGAIETFKRYN
jgi:hypothetical protein